jgi:hypothetical protein
MTDSDGCTKFKQTPETEKIIAEWRQKLGCTNDSDVVRALILAQGKARKGDDADKEGMKEITTKYGGKCINEDCSRKDRLVRVGERSWYGKYVGLMCIECHDKLEDGGDKDLVKKRLRLRYYERLTKQAKERAEKQLKDCEFLELPQKEAEALEKDKQFAMRIDEFLRITIDPNSEIVLMQEQKEKIEKMLDAWLPTHIELERSAKDINLVLEQHFKNRKPRKQIEETQSTP